MHRSDAIPAFHSGALRRDPPVTTDDHNGRRQMRGTNSNRRAALGFAVVISAAIALMPLLVETGPLSADSPARSAASQAVEIAALQ
jgi:hypothetical protein